MNFAKKYKILSMIKWLLLSYKVYLQDANRFVQHSHLAKKQLTKEQLESKLWAQAHVIEKGMSLPEPRLGYGQDGIKALLDFLNKYTQMHYSLDSMAYKNALSVLQSYISYHEERNFDVSNLKKQLALYDLTSDKTVQAGVVNFSKEEYTKLASGNFEQLANSRHTLRSFSSEPLDNDLIIKALELSRKTPSACNRQCWKVYWVKSPKAKKELLRLQKGHRGFGEAADSFLVITGDLSTCFGLEEYKQIYIDCGLYAMTLMNALHYKGVGVCPLNWCETHKKSQQLRSALGIPASDDIIMILGIGSLPAKVISAKSIRKQLKETLTEV